MLSDVCPYLTLEAGFVALQISTRPSLEDDGNTRMIRALEVEAFRGFVAKTFGASRLHNDGQLRAPPQLARARQGLPFWLLKGT